MTLSANEVRERFAANSSVVPLLLLTLSHPDMAIPGRVVRDGHSVFSRGNEFVAGWFDCVLPLDAGDELANVTLSVDNVDQQIVATLRSLDSPPTVTLEVVTSADPDTVEQGPFVFTAKSGEYNTLKVSVTLGYEEILNQPFPGGTYNPRDFPGLFS